MTDTKHTPEPWVFNQVEMKVKGSGDTQGLTVIANLSPNMDYSRGMFTQCANAQRIVNCVNALAGLTNEEVNQVGEWIKSQTKTLVFDYVSKNRILHSENERLKAMLELYQNFGIKVGGGGGVIPTETGGGGTGGTIHPNIIDETPIG
jgi:hypothetical protein